MVIKVFCQRCGKIWNYKGNSTYYASCPNCKTSVRLLRVVDSLTEETKSPIKKRVVAKATSLKLK
jgi:phage FluMu protein Com